MPLQMRMSASDPRFFSPDRDLAYCSPHLIHRALKGLDPCAQEPWITNFLKSNNVDPEKLVEAAKVMAEYMNKALLDPAYKHPLDAFKAVGFFDLPQEVQIIVLAKIGQVFMSGFFSSIRDVTRDPEDPPMDIKKFADMASELQKGITATNAMPKWRKRLCEKICQVRMYLGI